jgi:hypothetical protein
MYVENKEAAESGIQQCTKNSAKPVGRRGMRNNGER